MIMALVPVSIAAVVCWRGLRPVADAELQHFVDRFDVVVHVGDELFVRARLRRSRAVRLCAAAAGVLVAGLPLYMNLIDPTRSADFANPVVGNAWIASAAAAALLAEVLVIQWPLRDRRARLEARRPHDYVARRWTARLGVIAGATVVVAAVGLGIGRGDRLELAAGALGAVLAVGLTAFGLRQIADRPRLSSDEELRAIDDALRAYGAHHLVGAAIALATTSLATSFNAIVVGGWLFLLGPAATYWGLGAWWALAREQRWPMRRRAPAP